MDHVTRQEQITPVAPAPSPPGVEISAATAGAVTAWLVILAIAGFLVYRNAARSSAGDGAAWAVGIEVQGRYLVGADQITKRYAAGPNPANQQQMTAAAASLNKGRYSQRLRYAILVGELSGPSEARKALENLEKDRLEGL